VLQESLPTAPALPRLRDGAALRLFCFPYAGAGASLFSTWQARLPPEIEVCPVQLPGRESRWREAPLTLCGPLLEGVARALEPALDRPFALFGHSLGALLAFELARYLRRHAGVAPRRLFVSAHRAPHLPRSGVPFHVLPDAAFVEHVRRLGGTPAEVFEQPALRRLVVSLLRADLALCETYVYRAEAPLTCPIVACGAVQDRLVRPPELAAWRRHTRGPFALRLFPGDHFFVRGAAAPLLRAIAADLTSLADAA
jgi:medium-chain acyl-[acyl-carrier-protein] hydrolase